MKRILVLLAGMLLVTSTFASAADKLGYIELQRVLLESEPGKVAKETITKKVQELDAKVKARQDELKKIKDELEKQGVMLAADARAEREREYQQKGKDFQRFAKDSQEQLQQQDGELTRRILKEVLEVAHELGKKEGFTMILEKNESSVVYADPSVNLTDRVIQLYNEKSKKK